jgi:formylmethanofuran dehydrogenase subunit E
MSTGQIENLLKEMGYFRRIVEPGIVYGVKMILGVKDYLKIKDLKKTNLLVVAETSRCLPDTIEYLCGCTIGNRRLVIKDYGKMAATFIARDKRKAVRVTISYAFQKRDVEHSKELMQLKKELKFTEIENRRLKFAQEILEIPNEELLRFQEVEVTEPLSTIFMPSGIVFCEKCNESTRESKIQIRNGKKLCLVCAGVEKPYFKLKYGEELL